VASVGKWREKKMPGIVVGIDGSEHSRQALEWAAREASVRHTSLMVITVHQPVVGYWGSPVPFPYDPDLAKKALDAAREDTDSVLAKVGGAAVPSSVTVTAVTGLPGEELLRAAKDADMLVVGSRGAGGFKRLLMGSVSTQVTQHAHVPVVVIPADRT
jgi:nucleotide-binding universal stress UspA family protein